MAKLFSNPKENEQPIEMKTVILWYFISFVLIIGGKTAINAYLFQLDPSSFDDISTLLGIMLILIAIVHTVYLTVKLIVQRRQERKRESNQANN